MATEAQIAANRRNAQASTGPTSDAGRARASRNAVSSGLYSRGDFVLPDEQAQYAEFCAGFQSSLEPEGAIEQTLSAEIVHAAWRMRRCSAVAVGMTGSLDPMVDPAAAQTQEAIDRARNEAHRTFQRSLSELRRLQTERQFRRESFPGDLDLTTFGVASFKDLAPALMTATQRQMLLEKLRRTTKQQNMREMWAEQSFSVPNRDCQGAATPSTEQEPAFTIRTQFRTQDRDAQTPRNSPCTCGSGIKFKRCCGKGAPAVLNLAA